MVITDGRADCLSRTLASAARALPQAHRVLLVDDSGDANRRAHWCVDMYGLEGQFHEDRLGLAATVAHAWSLCDTDYLFHLEDDFVFEEPVDVAAMIEVLHTHAHVAQMCLLRQPWNVEEQAAGGIVEKDPDDYLDRDGWLEHRRLFSLNPCVIPKRIYEMGWDAGNERGFTDRLLAAGYSFGYWGNRGDPPRVTHIGTHRSPAWAL